MKNKICAVIVTFNRINFLKGAIHALKKQSLPVDIVVINNGSTDATKEYLDNETDISVVHQGNVGGAGGFFTGIKWVTENGYDFVWIMDDDVLPDEECVKQLYENYKWLTEEKKESIGFLCSKVINREGLSVNLPHIDMRLNETGYPDWNRHLENGMVKVDAATFVSVFIPIKIVHEVGLPIKEFFIWGDDTEYTLRISKKHNCYQIGKSFITHLRYGGNIDIITVEDPKRIEMMKYLYRNHLWLAKKGYKGKKGLSQEYKNNFIMLLRLLKRGQLKKIKVILKASVSNLTFDPKITYIHK